MSKRVIMDISAAMFHQRGYDRTSLEDIAAALQVTKPSLYYHFKNKQEILLACVTAAYDHFSDEILSRDQPSHNGRERIETFLRLYLDVISNDLGANLVVADDRVMTEAGRAQVRRLRRIMNDDFEARLQRAIDDGSIVASETRLTAAAIFGMFNWLGQWHLRRPTLASDEIYTQFTRLIFDGLLPR